MSWSPQQEAALRSVRDWIRRGCPGQVFRLFGYAGSGKTTLARELVQDVGQARFAAFTGKAAHVLQQKGCPATTIHKLIYRPKDKSGKYLKELEEELMILRGELQNEGHPDIEGHSGVMNLKARIDQEHDNLRRPMFELNEESELYDCELLVVDECSMVDAQMGNDLLSFQVPILVLGDPAQLPPIRGEGFFVREDTPADVVLTEIHRQAEGNPIIELATRVRKGLPLEFGDYGESRVMDWADMTPELALSHDQILVGKNDLRRGTNRRVREIKGFTGDYPVRGDRLVCLRNNHELGILNGSMWHVEDALALDDEVVGVTISSEDSKDFMITCDTHAGYYKGIKPPYWEEREHESFDFGYALTCHKAQGSQWPSVVIFDQSRVFGPKSRNWLYTAITRAAERVTVAV